MADDMTQEIEPRLRRLGGTDVPVPPVEAFRRGRRLRQAFPIAAAMGLVLFGMSTLLPESEPSSDVSPAEVPADESELDRADLAARKEVWLSSRPPAYAYDVTMECDCSHAGTYSVTVADGEILRAEPHHPGAEPYRLYSVPTPETAFAMLEEPLALAEGGEIPDGRASAAFDPTLGYPSSWTVIGSGGLPSHHGKIRNFEPVDSGAIDLPPLGLALVISNQSFADPDVRLTVEIDGNVMVDRSFAVENQHSRHSYLFPLDPGEHQVTVRADTGATHQRIVTLGPDRRFLYLNYWGDGQEPADPFTVQESEEPLPSG